MNLPVNIQCTRATLALAELPNYLGQEVAVNNWLTIDREPLQLFAIATYLTDADVDMQ